MAYIVALTGGIGSGKSTVAELFSKLGIAIVDADVIARQLLDVNPMILKLIFEHFGKIVQTDTQQLNRSALKNIIFNHPQERIWLNNLLHPLIEVESMKQLNKMDTAYVLWVCPLLIENSLYQKADSVLLVKASREVQRERVMLRDDISLELTNKILSSQLSFEERNQYASEVIDNERSLDEVWLDVKRLHQYYLAQSLHKSNLTVNSAVK